MGVKINPNKCMYCGGCASVCPANCLELKETRLIAHNEKCINCTACIKVCPVSAITLETGLKEETTR